MLASAKYMTIQEQQR